MKRFPRFFTAIVSYLLRQPLSLLVILCLPLLANAVTTVRITQPSQTRSMPPIFSTPARLVFKAEVSGTVNATTQVRYYQVVNGNETPISDPLNIAPYKFVWDNPSAATYTIVAKATSGPQQSWITSDSVDVVVQNDLPVITSTYLKAPNDSYYAGCSFGFSADIMDPNGTIASATLADETETWSATLTQITGTNSWHGTCPALSPGAHTLAISATDNESGVATLYINITSANPHPINSNYYEPLSYNSTSYWNFAQGMGIEELGSDLNDAQLTQELTVTKTPNSDSVTMSRVGGSSCWLGTWTSRTSIGNYDISDTLTDPWGEDTTYGNTITIATAPPIPVMFDLIEQPYNYNTFPLHSTIPIRIYGAPAMYGTVDITTSIYQGSTLVDTQTFTDIQSVYSGYTADSAGSYHIDSYARNHSNPALNVTTTRYFTVSANQAPTVDFPRNMTTEVCASINPSSVRIVACANDIDGTIAKVEYYLDTATTPFDTVTGNSRQFTGTWNIDNTVSIGSHTIRVKATDNDNAATTETFPFEVTAPEPAVDMLTPLDTDTFTGLYPLELNVNAYARRGTLSGVEFTIKESNVVIFTATAEQVGDSNTWRCEWIPEADGEYTITARATDSFTLYGEATAIIDIAPWWELGYIDDLFARWQSLNGDPVNMVTGEECHEIGNHIQVYNAQGPNVDFYQAWYSRLSQRGYSSPGLSCGWTQPYDYRLESQYGNDGDTISLFYPQGTVAHLTPVKSGGQLTGAFTVTGARFLASGVPDTTIPGRWTSITITFPDQTQYNFTPMSSIDDPIYILTTVTDRVGKSIVLNWDTVNRWLQSITTGDTNPTTLLMLNYTNGQLVNVTDGTRTVAYQYDATTSNLNAISASGISSWRTYNYTTLNNHPMMTIFSEKSPTGTGYSSCTFTYDSSTGKVTSVTDPRGMVETYTYSANANYDGYTILEDHDSLGALLHWNKFCYTGGLETRDENYDNNAVVYTRNDPVNPDLPTSIVDLDGKTTSFTYDSYGNVTTTVDCRNITTTLTYDYTHFAMGRLMSVQDSVGNKAPTTLTYLEPYGLVKTHTGPKPGSTTNETVTTTYTYDLESNPSALGNVVEIDSPGNDAVTTKVTTLSYTNGSHTTPWREAPVSITDGLNHTTQYQYDARGNATASINENNQTTSYSYNVANQLTEINLPATGQTGTGNGKIVNTYLYPGSLKTQMDVYDESNQLVRTATNTYDATGCLISTSGDTELKSYQYDGLSRLIAVRDGNQNPTGYTYDTLGHLTTITYPDSNTLNYTQFDAAGRVLERVDANGTMTQYSYDATRGWLTDIQYPAHTADNVHFTYDTEGRRTGMTDSTGATAYSYDGAGIPLSIETTYTGLAAKTIGYTYNPDGSRATMTTPVGSFTYQHDAIGRLVSLTDPYSDTSSWQYRADGALLQQTLGNGAVTDYTPDALEQLTALTNKDPNNTVLSSFSGITYDGNHNRTGVTATITNLPAFSGTTSFSYDTKGQLLSEQSTRGGGYTFTNVYDSAVNPTTFRGQTRTYNSNNQLTNTGYAFDYNGNATTLRGTTLTYDVENHLTQYGTLLTADYNGEGLRACKQTTAGRTYYLYDGSNPVCELQNNSGGYYVTAVNTFGAAGLLSRNEIGIRFLWYQFDSEGNVAQRLDTSGTVLSTDRYDAWGNLLAGGDTTDPYGYKAQSGYYTDHETGIILCTYRYYDPIIGRWINRDPIGNSSDINLYSYCANNPISFIDIFGLSPQQPTLLEMIGPPPPPPPIIYYVIGNMSGCGLIARATLKAYREMGAAIAKLMGYQVIFQEQPSKALFLDTLYNPRVVQLFIVGHGHVGQFDVNDKETIFPVDLTGKQRRQNSITGKYYYVYGPLAHRKLQFACLGCCYSSYNDDLKNALVGPNGKFRGSKGFFFSAFNLDLGKFISWLFQGPP